MKKIIICILGVLLLTTACGVKENKTIKETEKTIVVADDFTGVGGYIVKNSVFDYSNRFETVYEWCEGVKLPIPKFEKGKIELQEGGNDYYGECGLICVSNYRQDDLLTYIAELEKDGFTKEYVEGSALRHAYLLYKDNLLIRFICGTDYETKEPWMAVDVITGNVKKNTILDIKEARKIIDESGVNKDNDIYSQYILLEVSHKTVKDAGYVEYYMVAPKWIEDIEEEKGVRYVVIKDKEVVFCEQGIASLTMPSTVNIVKDDADKDMLVVTYMGYTGTSGELPVTATTRSYVLDDNKFVMHGVEKATGTSTGIHGLAIVDNGQIKYYTLKKNENVDIKRGYRDAWILDKEYIPE